MADNSPLLSPNCYVLSQRRKSRVTIMSEEQQSDDGNSEDRILENPPQKKVNIEAECAETGLIDWISQLPDALIVQILSLIPTIDACRTTILSKRWQYLWTSIDKVCYRNSSSPTVEKFISFTDNLLPLLSCSSIKEFDLQFTLVYDDDELYNPKFDQWLEFAVNKKVEDLSLHILYDDLPDENDQPYSLPQAVCSSASILKLDCSNCRLSEDYVLNWASLKRLSLGFLFIREEHIEQIMSNCPQLEFLRLYHFYGFNRLHMTSPKCTQLQLLGHDPPEGYWGSFKGDCCIEIVAPYVQHLEISDDFNHMEIRVRDLASLVHADLTFWQDEYDVFDETMVKDLLVGVCCASDLMVSSWFIEVISDLMLEEEDFSLPLLQCKQLTIRSHITNYSFPSIDYLLRSTPCLENLMIFSDVPFDECCFGGQGVDLSECNYLSLREDIFKVYLQKLKNIKVISSFCSHSHKDATKELPHLLKFLLEHAMNLEKLVIVPKHKGCNICSTNISNLRKNLNCRISEDCVLNWTSLKSLMLGYLFLRDEHIEQIMSIVLNWIFAAIWLLWF